MITEDSRHMRPRMFRDHGTEPRSWCDPRAVPEFRDRSEVLPRALRIAGGMLLVSDDDRQNRCRRIRRRQS